MNILMNKDDDENLIEVHGLNTAEFNYLAGIVVELMTKGMPESKGTGNLTVNLEDFDKPVISLNQLAEIMAAAHIYHDGCNNVMGNKIAAIKKLREITNCGLRPAKLAIEGTVPCL